MKHLKFLILLFIITLFSECSEKDNPPDCGCNSEILSTIPETSQTIGQISYKEQTQTNDYYTNKYWITIVMSDCPTCVRHFIVCNENIINDNIINLLDTQEPINIKFSGHIKEVCEKRFDIASISYSRITLTKIEKQ